MDTDLLFSVPVPLGFEVEVRREVWAKIVEIKQPVMKERHLELRETLTSPTQIRRSRRDPDVYLFYRPVHSTRWWCAVVKRQPTKSFLITAYPTDAIKEGEEIWSA